METKGSQDIEENTLSEIIQEKKNKFKSNGRFTLVLGITMAIMTLFFIINFQIDPSTFTTIFLFLADLVFFFVFMVFLERTLAAKEDSILIRHLVESSFQHNKTNAKNESMKNNEKLKEAGRIMAFFNGMFRMLEEFPYLKNKKGNTKRILQVIGWIVIVLLFSISVIFRQAVVEFGTGSIPLRNTMTQWTIYFGFYVFVLSTGGFVLYLAAKSDPYRIFKLSIFGVILMIQIPATLDYFFNPAVLPYHFVHWEDFILLFNHIFLHPDLSYAVGIGHFVMLVALMVLFGWYVAVKRIEYASHYKSKIKIFFISSRVLLSAFLIYFITVVTAVTPSLLENILNPLGAYTTEIVLLIIFNMYFIPLFLYLFLEIYLEEKRKKTNRQGTIQMNTLFSLINDGKNLKNRSFQKSSKKENEYKSSFKRKLSILITVFIIFIIVEILIIWVIPGNEFSFW